jgi:hypothetical protein
MMKKLLLTAAVALPLAMMASGAQAHDRSRDRGCWLFDGFHRSAHTTRGHRKHAHRAHRKGKAVKTKAAKSSGKGKEKGKA